ncbi:unnamed protein product, partial [Thelazia callipaeda]|uniref:Pept_C1 domain-containing protein n=1 Tax=Thelazia callipaeda TaxID=103827 RepID=A0A0N5CTR7_THECL
YSGFHAFPEEFEKLNGLRPERTKPSGSTNFPELQVYGPLPDMVDWRQRGAVTRVKDQGDCGSCWAFSTIGAMEGQQFLRSGSLTELSEQNILDCSDEKYGNYGCDGGLMMNAFAYVIDNNGVDTEKSYPYLGYQGVCRYSNLTRGSSAFGSRLLPYGDEDMMKLAVAVVGPISVAFNANPIIFYNGGVFYEEDCSDWINHGVTAVGYGTDKVKLKNGTTVMMDYWLLKNSWGSDWGENGYLRIARNQ